jgi:hypothetical protein
MADSGHEYLLKQYLQTGKTDKTLLEMCTPRRPPPTRASADYSTRADLRFTNHVMTRMMWLTPERQILYAVSTSGTPPNDVSNHVFEHLACFLPGLFALGVQTLPLDDLASVGVDFAALGADLSPASQEAYALLSNYKLSDLHRWAADGMTEACAVLYHDMPTGLSPDSARMDYHSVRWIDALEDWRARGASGAPPGVGPVRPVRQTTNDAVEREYAPNNPAYELRPETLESIFLMWRLTHDTRWRVHGWNILRALQAHSRTPSGFASLRRVGTLPADRKDSMPSYFPAETLKYLYLLFAGDELVPLHDWVFNTEAHPLPVFSWTAEEVALFGIEV